MVNSRGELKDHRYRGRGTQGGRRTEFDGADGVVWLDMLIIAMAVCTVIVGGYGVYDLLLARRPARTDDKPTAGHEKHARRQTGLLGSVFSSAGVELCPHKQQANILIIGTDESKEYGRADTIILVMLRKDTHRGATVSIPRDLKVYLPGYGYQKINAVYAYFDKSSAPAMMAQAVEQILHRRVDFYLKTDVAQFPKLFDALGGLDLYVDKDMYWHDDAGGLHIDLEKGRQHLNGDQIEGFVRHRRDLRGRPSSDFERTRRQQYVLKQLIRQKSDLATLKRLPEVVGTLKDMVATDMSTTQLVALGLVTKQIDLENMISKVVPTVPHRNHGWYAILQPDKTEKVMSEVRTALRTRVAETDGSGDDSGRGDAKRPEGI